MSSERTELAIASSTRLCIRQPHGLAGVPEDGARTFLRHVCKLLPDGNALHLARHKYSRPSLNNLDPSRKTNTSLRLGNTRYCRTRIIIIINIVTYNGSTPFSSRPGSFFSFLILYTVGLGRGISPPQSLYLNTAQHEQNKHAQSSMPRAGYEHITKALHRSKTVHTFDYVATVIGPNISLGNRAKTSPAYQLINRMRQVLDVC